MTRSFVRPAPLSPGDVVRVVAPAGAFDRTLFFRGLGWLASVFRVRFEPDVRARLRFLAGPDERRSGELQRALDDGEARAVLVARGGHGCTRLIDRIDFSPLTRRPKWLVGFSDATALHAMLQHWGVRSLHAHNVTGLGVGDAREREAWLAALTGPPRSRSYELTTLYGGNAVGPLCGGNLAVLAAALSGRAPQLPSGAVLFLEDVREAPYRVDRLLVELERHGVFDRVAGIVTGYFTPHNPETTAVLAAAAARLRVPWLHGLPCGHERPNVPLELGAPATIQPGRLTLGDG